MIWIYESLVKFVIKTQNEIQSKLQTNDSNI